MVHVKSLMCMLLSRIEVSFPEAPDSVNRNRTAIKRTDGIVFSAHPKGPDFDIALFGLRAYAGEIGWQANIERPENVHDDWYSWPRVEIETDKIGPRSSLLKTIDQQVAWINRDAIRRLMKLRDVLEARAANREKTVAELFGL